MAVSDDDMTNDVLMDTLVLVLSEESEDGLGDFKGLADSCSEGGVLDDDARSLMPSAHVVQPRSAFIDVAQNIVIES